MAIGRNRPSDEGEQTAQEVLDAYRAALLDELENAKRTKAGGQPPDPARIAAIEAEIKRAGKAPKKERAVKKGAPEKA